ncbi:MAG: LON peptidase substrate-binding domain-containing protein [Actinomycetota bacterium]
MTNRVLPIFPLGAVVYPGQTLGLYIFEDRYKALLADVQETLEFGTYLVGGPKVAGRPLRRSPIGTVVQVTGVQPLNDGKALVAIEGKQRFLSRKWLEDAPYPRAVIDESPCSGNSVNSELLHLASDAVMALRALHSEIHLQERLDKSCPIEGSDKSLVWQLAALAPLSLDNQYRLLAVTNPNARLRLLRKLCNERFDEYQRLIQASAHESEWSADL